ncbi:MAG TPA: hypothetical protein DCE78_13085 [Bacteroidetes bacterium]|nr:hypothetical protein [Bacteroidota bacterium]
MPNPFDAIIDEMIVQGYHNQRKEIHSDRVGLGIQNDLLKQCREYREDTENGVIKSWINTHTPGARGRKIDLFVGAPTPAGQPDIHTVRLVIENKSVITAHRNVYARYDDLKGTMEAIHSERPETIRIATILVGTATRFLNVADRIKTIFPRQWAQIQPRLLSGDETLWDDFPSAISKNKENEPATTIRKLRDLGVREAGQTHSLGYDFILIVPVFIDNVNQPRIARQNPFGIDVDADYNLMLSRICTAYHVRWHM